MLPQNTLLGAVSQNYIRGSMLEVNIYKKSIFIYRHVKGTFLGNGLYVLTSVEDPGHFYLSKSLEPFFTINLNS